jgi:hypothetical protein
MPHSSVLEVYDPAAGEIVRKRAIAWPRVAFATAVAGGRIYALGGHLSTLGEPHSGVDVYDPAGDTWTRVAELSGPKSWAGAVGIGTRILVMGGVQAEWPRPESAVDVLDLEAGPRDRK